MTKLGHGPERLIEPGAFLELKAQSSQLFVLIDIPWSKHLSFDTADRKAGARAVDTGAGVLDPLQAVTAADRR